MVPIAFMSFLYTISNILRQFEQFFVELGVRGDHFQLIELPRVAFGVSNFAPGFFQDERYRREIMSLPYK